VRVIVGDVIRDGMGSGHGIDADCGLAHESAIKEAETDAMKRALMTFGNPFGLALYDKEQRQVVEVISENSKIEEVNEMVNDIMRMQTTVGLRKWWRQTVDRRNALGLVNGTEEYQALYEIFVKHGKKLSAGESVNG
jgi:recombination DNA repair RAD52 pathway protein